MGHAVARLADLLGFKIKVVDVSSYDQDLIKLDYVRLLLKFTNFT